MQTGSVLFRERLWQLMWLLKAPQQNDGLICLCVCFKPNINHSSFISIFSKTVFKENNVMCHTLTLGDICARKHFTIYSFMTSLRFPDVLDTFFVCVVCFPVSLNLYVFVQITALTVFHFLSHFKTYYGTVQFVRRQVFVFLWSNMNWRYIL